MNKIHLPMDFTDEEKPLVLEYLKKFKHSPLSIKMLLCAYYGSHYKSGYIDFESYLTPSIKTAKYSSYVTEDDSLVHYWNMKDTWKTVFFGFNRNTILNGTISDVENMVTETHLNYIERQNASSHTLANGVH